MKSAILTALFTAALISTNTATAEPDLTREFANCMAEQWHEGQLDTKETNDIKNHPVADYCAKQIELSNWQQIDWHKFISEFTCETVASFCSPPTF